MGKIIHRLSDIDAETKTATCKGCGPDSPIQWRSHRSEWACKVSNSRKNPESRRGAYLRFRFGIDLVDFRRLSDAQGGRCAICGESCPTGRNLAVDHNHTTGAIRGLLCNMCNRGLGFFADDPDRLAAAAAYLRSHQ